MKLTKNGVLAIQAISSFLLVAMLILNRYEAGIPDFVQGLGFGLCIGGFALALANLKRLRSKGL